MLKKAFNIHLSFQQLFFTFSLLFFSVAQVLAQTNTSSLHHEFELKEEKNKYGSRSYYGEVEFTLMGRRYDDPFVNSRWGRTIVAGKLGGKYQDWLEGKLEVAQLLTSGASSTQMGVTEAGPTNGTFLDQASLTIAPVSWVSGTAGVLTVELNPISSTMYDQAQAGAALKLGDKWKTNAGDLEFSVLGSQTIPTAKSSGSVITDEETMPLLTVGTVYAKWENEDFGTSLGLSAGRFEFTDLSTSAAADSQKLGSSVTGGRDLQFLYEYRGTEYAASISQKIGLSHEIKLKGSVIENELAPEGLNSGYMAKFEYTRTFDKWEISPSVNVFRAEADVFPALYTQPGMGYTNRLGYGANVEVNFPKEKFNVFAGYTNAKAIREAGIVQTNTETSTYQADREIFTLGAEVKYDIF